MELKAKRLVADSKELRKTKGSFFTNRLRAIKNGMQVGVQEQHLNK